MLLLNAILGGKGTIRIAQLQADIKIDGIPILFAWPSQGLVGAYEMDKQSANNSRDYLMALLTMLSSSSEISDIMVVAHSMGAMLTVEALRQLRIEGKDRVIARQAGSYWRRPTSTQERSVPTYKLSVRSSHLCLFWFPRMIVRLECPVFLTVV